MIEKIFHLSALWFLIFFINSRYSYSQYSVVGSTVQFHIADSATGVSVPYVNIYNKSTSNGTVSNIEGFCQLQYQTELDEINFSCVGYKLLKLKVADILKYDTILIASQALVLTEYSYSGEDDTYIKWISSLKSKGKGGTINSKTYFLLETFRDNNQLEMVEVYFNGKFKGYKIDRLNYKEGRIALGVFDNRVFASTEISSSFYDFDIFQANDNFPSNPLQMDKKSLRDKYKFRLTQKYYDERGILIHAVKFYPREEQGFLFEGTLWIDSTGSLIKKIQLKGNNMQVFPFLPLFSTDSLMDVAMELNISFDESNGNAVFNNINFNYSFQYLPRMRSSYLIRSNAFLYAYDPLSEFLLPFFDSPNPGENDYRRISSSPYNDVFWDNKEEFILYSENNRNDEFFNKQDIINSKSFFKDYFNENKGFFQDPYLFWNTSRIRLKPHADDSLAANSKNLSLMPSERYHIGIKLYMDINTVNDSMHVFTATVFDPFDTYYNLPIDDYADCFVNIYFDIVEIARRQLEVEIKRVKNDPHTIRSAYLSKQNELKSLSDIFFMEVEHGTNKDGMIKWNKYVEGYLGINNINLFNLYKN